VDDEEDESNAVVELVEANAEDNDVDVDVDVDAGEDGRALA
jgi:hypothetical protein